MKTYRIFLKKQNNAIEDLQIVQAGFSWLGFCLSYFYLFAKKLYLKGFIFLLVGFLLEFTFNIVLMLIGYLLISLYIGLHFANWYSKNLEENGYIFLGNIQGNSIKEAKMSFLENFNKNYNEKDKLEQKVF